MTLSNREIIQRFASGKTKGKANRMEIKELPDGSTALVGYGWAVYGKRDTDGIVTLYDDWYGYSFTTSTHLNLLRPHADKEKDEKPEWSKMLASIRKKTEKVS